MEVDEEFANPELPLTAGVGGAEEVGAVAGTLYTKAWLLDALVRLVKTLEGQSQASMSVDEDAENELDSLLSKLWDVSAEAPVASFLVENKIIDIILPACLNADPASVSRQVEIAIGTLANVVSFPETKLAEEIVRSEFYRQGVIGLFSKLSSDADVIIQSCRLLNACFHCEASDMSIWEDTLIDLNLTSDVDEEAEEFSLPEFFLFILRSCKNEHLLLEVAKLLELLCGNVGRFLHQFAASLCCVSAVIEALRELRWSPQSECVCRFINVLYMICTVDVFREELSALLTTDEDDVVMKLTSLVMNLFPKDEDFELDDISCALASSFSLLLSLLTVSSPSNFPVLFQRNDLWHAVKKTNKLLAKHKFAADDEQSPAAILKLNVVEFIESIRASSDVNVEQYVLNKIL